MHVLYLGINYHLKVLKDHLHFASYTYCRSKFFCATRWACVEFIPALNLLQPCLYFNPAFFFTCCSLICFVIQSSDHLVFYLSLTSRFLTVNFLGLACFLEIPWCSSVALWPSQCDLPKLFLLHKVWHLCLLLWHWTENAALCDCLYLECLSVRKMLHKKAKSMDIL